MSFAPDHEKNRCEKQEVTRALKAARQLELQANVDGALVSCCFWPTKLASPPALLTKLTGKCGWTPCKLVWLIVSFISGVIELWIPACIVWMVWLEQALHIVVR